MAGIRDLGWYNGTSSAVLGERDRRADRDYSVSSLAVSLPAFGDRRRKIRVHRHQSHFRSSKIMLACTRGIRPSVT